VTAWRRRRRRRSSSSTRLSSVRRSRC
jgi:hypothetical protein